VGRLESVPDPKCVLRDALLAASGRDTQRRRKQFLRDLPETVRRVSECVADFRPLRQLEAFRAFEADLDAAVLTAGMLQSSPIALGRVATRGLFWRTFDSGAWSDRREGPYAAVIRPAGCESSERLVLFSPDGLAVESSAGETHVAASLDGRRSFGSDTVRHLSPFTLLDATTPGLEADLVSIEDHLRSLQQGSTRDWRARSGIPTEDSILAGLASPNVWVRAAARCITEAGGPEVYPRATQRLASAPR
jgi:hypothetical protein